jgi:Cof subfamily protein (haloacid dehalogenase superfamily)
MENRKLFAFDLDGTLLNTNKMVSERSIITLNRLSSAGHLMVIATARPPRDVVKLIPKELLFNYVICYNGAEIYKGVERLFQLPIDADLAYYVITELQARQPNLFLGIESTDVFHVNSCPRHLFGEVDHVLISLSNNEHQVFKDGVVKIICEGLQTDVEAFINGALNDLCSVTHTDKGSIVQIMSKGINKWEALKFIAEIEQISNSSIVAFGDDHNDIAMITSCGVGVVMENASPALITVAKYSTATNDQDGVAKYLETHYI